MREKNKVKRSLRLVMILAGWTVTQLLAQAAGPQASPAATVGASAVWQPARDFVANAHRACDKDDGNPSNYGQCFLDQMPKAGAPADAVSFTRMLYQQSDGQVGIMSGFEKYGPVNAAQVFYPLRANDNYGLLLISGDRKILDVDDLTKLDQTAMEQDPLYQSIKKHYPSLEVWPGDRSGSEPWPRLQPLPDGGQQFIVSYPLINGCHACRHLGIARFGWDFDANGNFLRTTYLPTPPPPRLLKRPRGQQTKPAPPAQQPPQAQPNPQ
jgi:hypothetical protein